MRAGVYRRRIRVVSGPGEVRADLEDDPHRHGVILRHDGRTVTAIEGLPLRTPWSLCPESAPALRKLVGMTLSPHPLAVYRHTAGSRQCTHMFDLAGLAVAHAARGIARRDYEVAVACPGATAPRQATLRRDGVEVLAWTVEGTTITAPEPFAGRGLKTLLGWAEGAFADPDAFEAIVVLRRSMHISNSRESDLDSIQSAGSIDWLIGACYVFQPGVAERTVRNLGTTRDFTETPQALLADLDP